MLGSLAESRGLQSTSLETLGQALQRERHVIQQEGIDPASNWAKELTEEQLHHVQEFPSACLELVGAGHFFEKSTPCAFGTRNHEKWMPILASRVFFSLRF